MVENYYTVHKNYILYCKSLICAPPCSYTHYGQQQTSITDILSLSLRFVQDQTSWEHREGTEGGSGTDDREDRQAEKRARVSLFPSPRYCSEQEAEVMEACLTRWTKELRQDMEGKGLVRRMKWLVRRMKWRVRRMKWLAKKY